MTSKTRGAIYQRASDGLWCGTIELGRDANGKRIRKVIYGQSREDVASLIAAFHLHRAYDALPSSLMATNVAKK